MDIKEDWLQWYINFLMKSQKEVVLLVIIIIIIIIIIIRFYTNSCSGQRALALIGWFERATILCGGTEAQKQQSHRSNSDCWTSVLVTLIGHLCGTDPYSFMKDHVISIEEVSCLVSKFSMHHSLTMPNQRNCVCEVADKQ